MMNSQRKLKYKSEHGRDRTPKLKEDWRSKPTSSQGGPSHGGQNTLHSKERSTPPKNASQEALHQFRCFVRKGEFLHQHDMRRFVVSALQSGQPEEVLLILSDDAGNGVKLLKDLVSRPMTVDAGIRSLPVSFQRVILPLLGLVISFPDIYHKALRSIYTCLFQDERGNFIYRILQCLHDLMQRGSMADHYLDIGRIQERDIPTTYIPAHWTEAILVVIRVFNKSLCVDTDAQVNARYRDWYGKLKDLWNGWQQKSPSSDEYHQAKSEIKKLLKNIGNILLEPEENLATAEQGTSDWLHRQAGMGSRGTLASAGDQRSSGPGPGDLRPEGPRHDNDFSDFRKICILPTSGEIFAEDSPYLPKPGVEHHLPEGVDRYLDIQFRLLREDVLASVRAGISYFVQNGNEVLKRLGSNGTFYRVDGKNSVDLVVFRRATIESLAPNIRRGLLLKVSFDQPAHAKSDRLYWTKGPGKKHVQKGSLIVLWLGAKQDINKNKPIAQRKIFFAVVAERNDEDLEVKPQKEPKKRPQIGLQLLDFSQLINVVSDHVGRQEAQDENLLLQVRGHFFNAGEAVLKALQSLSSSTMPFVETIVLGNLEPKHPRYLNIGTCYDLRCLLKAGTDNVTGLQSVNVADFDSLRHTLHRYQRYLDLDATQSEALAAALSQEISLIQGPPGCGKTHVGIHIIKALLANIGKSRTIPSAGRSPQAEALHLQAAMQRAAGVTPTLGADAYFANLPILCICYTNHALDQFLEGLMNAGVPADDIIRVGGRSRSVKLEQRNLGNLMYGARTAQEIKRSKNIEVEAGDLSRQIDQFVERQGLPPHKWRLENLVTLLELYSPEQLENLRRGSMLVDEDGFRRFLGTEGEHTDALQIWVRGLDLEHRSYEVARSQSHEINSGQFDTQNAFSSLSIEDDGDERILYPNLVPVVKHGDEGAAIALPPEQTRDLEDLRYDSDVWKMSRAERMTLFNYWKEEYMTVRIGEFKRDCEKYSELVEEYNDLSSATQGRILRDAKVVGITTSGAASKMKLLRNLAPSIVMCEEAGEVFESHIIASLSQGTQHLIMIGDHQQLRPKVEQFALSVDARSGYNLDMSLFERLVRLSNNRPKGAQRNVPMVSLATQRRMRPEIADLLRKTKYYPVLEDGDNVFNYPAVKGMRQNLWFFDHDYLEEGGKEGESRSKANEREASMVVALVGHLIKQGYARGQIAVLTPYAGQAQKLREKCKEQRVALYVDDRTLGDIHKMWNGDPESEDDDSAVDGDTARETAPPSVEPSTHKKQIVEESRRASLVKNLRIEDRVRLSTVDNFQGEEAEIVIISTVRCNRAYRTGFLKIDNRVNVMMSRAKHGMFVFGSADTIRRGCRGALFTQMLNLFDENNRLGPYLPLKCERHESKVLSAHTVEELRQLAPDGGCDEPCGFKLECGHMCPRSCHPDDENHKAFPCKEQCMRLLECGHPCQSLCCNACGPCKERLDIVLSCGHSLRIKCHQARDPPPCPKKVQRTMPVCGHQEELRCHVAARLDARSESLRTETCDVLSESDSIFMCSKHCGKVLDCGHTCKSACGKCLFVQRKSGGHQGACTEVCGRKLLCGHECRGVCHGAKECPPCRQPCGFRCQHSKCPNDCSTPCSTCSMQCPWSCIHKGRCLLPCGSPCCRLPCDERCDKILSCGCQCPSVCGEPCPKPSQACPKCASPQSKTSVVDMIMFTRLEDYDLDEGPLLALNCGHCFTTESLDGIVELQKYYRRSDDGAWQDILPLPSACQAIPSCPHCRSPISGIRRYARLLNHAFADQTTRKFNLSIETQVRMRLQDRETVGKRIEELRKKLDVDNVSVSTLQDLHRNGKTVRRVNKDVKRLIHQASKDHPAKLTWEKSSAALMRIISSSTRAAKCEQAKKQLRLHEAYKFIPAVDGAIKAHIGFLAWGQVVIKSAALEVMAITKSQSRNQRDKADTVKIMLRKSFGALEQSIKEVRSQFEAVDELCNVSKSRRSAGDALKEFLMTLYVYLDEISWLRRSCSGLLDEIKEALRTQQQEILAELKEIASKRIRALTSAKEDSLNTQQRAAELDATHKLLVNAEKLCRETFIETVSLKEKQDIFNAMGSDVGTGVGSYGGHWFTCPNGHVYTIGVYNLISV
ncbi:uncharacterized protein SPPG_08964 [Spizellomyces punctatus DAOM BR117]|uniref:NF-X1-type domain-containing protein n=1 Tax=Spizellomyces punctatus (strain DAOM BR117) TaxID=645134 RepID=A0A0L0HNW2_SPIPD|nr:uncharacterized protein SPPG_08964 [Spizellomyces punctatus DAOM BR117]KND02782.1 hypothetical protein SPPG_08964 [Spizellomyces punctatus DAOM BR117]|eukprot:XP_016610821.1 hypothetical protein SPPG_08964 [Spizellomyces punctatus DAOM BR117]